MEEAAIIYSATNGRYSVNEKIGSGAYGIVYKAKDNVHDETVAMKMLKNDRHCSTEDFGGAPLAGIREIGILVEFKTIRHCNIVNLKDVLLIGTNCCLVMEYMEWDLLRLMLHFAKQCGVSVVRNGGDGHGDGEDDSDEDDEDDSCGVGLPPRLYQSIAHQLLHAMDFCHSIGVCHRDIKPANILVAPNGVVKLADFGLARSLAHRHRTLSLSVVTLTYRSPELMLGAPAYTEAVDIWSVACVIAEMITGNHLFYGDSEIHQLFVIFERLGTPSNGIWPGVEHFPDYNPAFPKFSGSGFDDLKLLACARDLLEKMLQLNPAQRISARAAMSHEFFSDVGVVPLSAFLLDC